MPFAAETIANAFIDKARENHCRLTNMQLQKLVYIAHGFTLAFTNEQLIYHDVKAWQFGPVYPKLYKKLRKYGAGVVSDMLPQPEEDEIKEGSEEMQIIEAVWNTYGRMTGAQLSARTHAPGTPWSQTWSKSEYANISHDLIKEHFKGLLPATA